MKKREIKKYSSLINEATIGKNEAINEHVKHAHAITDGNNFFSNIGKEDLLLLYTELDVVYGLFKRLGIVDIYSKNEILKDFEIIEDMGGTKSVSVDGKSEVIPLENIIAELVKIYKK